MQRSNTLQRPRAHGDHGELGFTLIEIIVSITLFSILAVVVVPFLRMPMTAYMDATQRAELTAELDASVAKMREDLSQAMPNSVRVRQVGTRQFLEFMPARAVGRYRAGASPGLQQCSATCSGAGNNDMLQFASCSESCFTALGPLQGAAPVAGTDWVVVNPIATTGTPGTPGIVSRDPYFGGATAPANGVKSRLQGYAPATGMVTMTPHQFPTPPTLSKRQFYVVGTPVSYECNPITQQLIRYDGYAIATVQPTAFPAGNSARLASSVSACTFRYDATGGLGRGGVVTVWLRFSLPSPGTRQPEAVESFSEIGVRESG